MKSKACAFVAIALLVSVWLVSCSKAVPGEEENLPGDQKGEGYIQATINGKKLLVDEKSNELNLVDVSIGGSSANQLTISGSTSLLKPANYVSIYLMLTDADPIKAGKYTMDVKNPEYYPFMAIINEGNINGNLNIYLNTSTDFDPDFRVTLEITKFSNKKGEYMEGNFEIINGMKGTGLKTYSLTDGKFKARVE
ncbi:MAG: hypothetical protein QM594_13735 [Niabella sp.]